MVDMYLYIITIYRKALVNYLPKSICGKSFNLPYGLEYNFFLGQLTYKMRAVAYNFLIKNKNYQNRYFW